MNFRFAIKLTISFFIIGTIIMILYYWSMSARVAMLAFQFNIIVMLATWVYTGFLLFKFLRQQISSTELLKTVGVLLVNIPVGLIYTYIMTVLLNYARVDFQNGSENEIAEIIIRGCEEKSILNLESGKSETRWIKLTQNCSVVIEYDLNQTHYQDTVLIDLNPGSGLKTAYVIDR